EGRPAQSAAARLARLCPHTRWLRDHFNVGRRGGTVGRARRSIRAAARRRLVRPRLGHRDRPGRRARGGRAGPEAGRGRFAARDPGPVRRGGAARPPGARRPALPDQPRHGRHVPADLLEAAAAHTAQELRARGAHLALVSGLDILRDPRWGRTEECFGEDPLLAARCVRALVRGYRTQPGLGVVLKHFAGQGAAMGGRNGSGAAIGPRELAEIHLPAARAGVAAGALGVMAAYNDLDGVPCTANAALLTDVLRDAWGFEGIVMSDMFAVDRLQRAGLSPAEAAAVALRAGVDLSMADVSYTAIEEAVERGLIAERYIDRACARVLGVKIRLGLLDEPTAAPSFPAADPMPEFV